jgi:hypothetical protein
MKDALAGSSDAKMESQKGRAMMMMTDQDNMKESKGLQ